jgi:hypothetical protein
MWTEAAAYGCRGPWVRFLPGKYLATAPAAVTAVTLWYGTCISAAR